MCGEVAVVPVEGEDGGVELGAELAGEGGFAGAGTAADADHQRALGEGELGGGHVREIVDCRSKIVEGMGFGVAYPRS